MQSKARTATDGLAGSFRKAGEVAGGVLAAGITAKLTEFASRGFAWVMAGADLASAFNESLSKVRTVFGESAGEIEAWATGAADSIGLAEGAALNAAGTFGTMFEQIGFAAGATSDMSTSMVNLAADFASFHNADITEVIDAQSAAFRGEYDSIQRFLPTLNAAAVEQQALAMTGKAAASELTAQEKALAVYTFMLENAGAAQGDFARTADGTANAQRRADAAMENFQTRLGQHLIPVLDAVAKAQIAVADAGERYLLPALERVGQFVSDHRSEFEALGDVLGRLGGVIQDQLGRVLETLDLTTVEALAIALGTLLAGAAVVLGAALAGTAVAAAPFIIILNSIVVLVGSARKVIDLFSDAVSTLSDKVPGVAEGLGFMADVLGTIADLGGSAFGALTDGLGETPAVLAAIQEALAGITVDPETLGQLTAFADQALGSMEADALAAESAVEELEAQLEELVAQIQEMAGQYDTTAVFRSIEEDAASLTEQAKALEGQIYNTATGFDRTSEAGRSMEEGMEGLHGEVLTLAEQFVNGEISAATFRSGQERVREVIRQVAEAMGATEAETQALIDQYAQTPEEVNTRVTMVDAASAGLANIVSKIDRIPGFKSITVQAFDNASAALNNIANKVSRIPSGTTIRRASGGPASGATLVGEDGPEIVDLPAGAFVHSSPASGALAGGGGGGGAIVYHLYFAGSLYAERDVEEIVANLQRRGGTR